MEDITLASTFPTSDPIPDAPALPEALQPPTKLVSMGFMLALGLANTAISLAYGGVLVLLLPLQVGSIDPANKVIDLGIITSITVLLALVCNPIAGALSDRTISRFGRRRPWIFVGTIISALALALLMTASSIPMLFVGMAVFQLFSSFVLAALIALIPDQVPEAQRGTVSGIVGLATAIGSIFGAVIIGIIIKSPTPSYAVLIIILVGILIPFSLLLREKVLPKESVQAFRMGAFLKNFWIDPRKHPDFGWAWLTRFIPLFGYGLGTGYLLYYLQDAFHYEQHFPGQTTQQGVSTLVIIATLVALVSTVVGGIISDRIKRRKPFIILAYIIVAATLVVFAFVPSWTLMMIDAAVLGIGYGFYGSVDAALVTEVLPSAKDRAKDLGIINIANTLPQSLAPAVAAFIISISHNYFVLFVSGAAILLIGILAVRPIKAVR